ncbi:MAG: hypothetical protein ACT4TC_23100, partial [Myxococcaceae bacterium]
MLRIAGLVPTLVLLGACGLSTTETPANQEPGALEKPSTSPRTNAYGPVLRIPISFHTVAAGDASVTRAPVDQAFAKSLVAHTNEVWAQCGIELMQPTLHPHALHSIADLQLSPSDIDAEVQSLYAQMGQDAGSGPVDYMKYIAPVTGAPKKLAPSLFRVPVEELGTSEVPVLLLSDARVVHQNLSASVCHTQISRDGLLDFYFNTTENPEPSETRFVNYGFDADTSYEKATPPDWDLVAGRYYS